MANPSGRTVSRVVCPECGQRYVVESLAKDCEDSHYEDPYWDSFEDPDDL